MTPAPVPRAGERRDDACPPASPRALAPTPRARCRGGPRACRGRSEASRGRGGCRRTAAAGRRAPTGSARGRSRRGRRQGLDGDASRRRPRGPRRRSGARPRTRGAASPSFAPSAGDGRVRDPVRRRSGGGPCISTQGRLAMAPRSVARTPAVLRGERLPRRSREPRLACGGAVAASGRAAPPAPSVGPRAPAASGTRPRPGRRKRCGRSAFRRGMNATATTLGPASAVRLDRLAVLWVARPGDRRRLPGRRGRPPPADPQARSNPCRGAGGDCGTPGSTQSIS